MKSILRVLLMLSLGSVPAWAALGGSVATVTADVQAFNGQHQLFSKVGYNLHQITTRGGVVNEFVSSNGTVFGVSWQGQFHPDFRQLLGTHLTDLQSGQRINAVGRRGVTIQNTDFVLVNVGHGHFFRGRAYIPSLVPANLTAEVVQ